MKINDLSFILQECYEKAWTHLWGPLKLNMSYCNIGHVSSYTDYLTLISISVVFNIYQFFSLCKSLCSSTSFWATPWTWTRVNEEGKIINQRVKGTVFKQLSVPVNTLAKIIQKYKVPGTKASFPGHDCKRQPRADKKASVHGGQGAKKTAKDIQAELQRKNTSRSDHTIHLLNNSGSLSRGHRRIPLL